MPKLPAIPQQPPTRVTRSRPCRRAAARRPPSRAPRCGGSAAAPRPCAGQVGRLAARSPRGCSASVRALRRRRPSRWRGVVAQHRQAGRLQHDHRDVVRAYRVSSSRRPSRCVGPRSSWPVLIQVSPQHSSPPTTATRWPAASSTPRRGRDRVRCEAVGERVRPDHHVAGLACDASVCGAGAPARAAGRRRAGGSTPAAALASATDLQAGVGQPRRRQPADQAGSRPRV